MAVVKYLLVFIILSSLVKVPNSEQANANTVHKSNSHDNGNKVGGEMFFVDKKKHLQTSFTLYPVMGPITFCGAFQM